VNDRGGVPYIRVPAAYRHARVWSIPHQRFITKLVRHQELRSVSRAARPDGISGRQWVKLRKARQRAKKGVLK
jgi:hypothetical protein